MTRAREALGLQLPEQLEVLALAAPDHRRQHLEPGALVVGHDPVDDLLRGLALDHRTADRAVRTAGTGVEQAQVVVDLGDRADGRARVLRGRLLVDRHREPSTTAAGLTGKGSAELVKVDAMDAVYLESRIPGKTGSSRMVWSTGCTTTPTRGPSRRSGDRERSGLRLFDETEGTAVNAERLFWDLATERYDIISPTPITSPR